MENKKNLPLVKIAPFLCIIAFIFVLGVIVYCGLSGEYESTRFSSESDVIEVKAYSDPWGSNPVGENFPGIIGKTESVFVMVPKIDGDDNAMMFKSAYCRCEVYLNENNTLIGSYAQKPSHSFGDMTGNIRVVIPIPEDLSEKTLRIDISTYYDTTVDYPDVTFGTEASLKFRVFRDNLLRLAICLILVMLIFLAIGVGLFEYAVGYKDITKMLFDFIAFVICILTWMICSSDIPQFITNANENVSLISFVSLAMIGIPFAAFCEKALSYGRKVFAVSSKVGWLLPSTICLCYVTDVCDPYHILVLTHLYLAANLIVAIVCSFKQCKEDKGARIMAGSLIVLAVFAITGFILFYMSKTGGLDAIFFGGGLALFIMMLFALMIYRQMGYYEKEKEAEMYKFMAYTDFLTGIPNRSAYEDKIYELITNYSRRYVAFFVFDLNNLKLFNDMYGHQEGDRAIIATAECIRNAFDKKGYYFRLGGDEFAAIITDSDSIANSCSAEFKQNLEKYNAKAEKKISVAVGWAEDYQTQDATFFRKIFSKADADMYSEKQRMKNS